METRCEDFKRSQRRPFLKRSGLVARGCSNRLQRLAVSFSSDHSLRTTSERLLEHHGVEVSKSTVDRLLTQHSKRAASESPSSPASVLKNQGSDTILTGADGTMIPVWVYDESASDRRKSKHREFKEMRLFVAREQGRSSSSYAGGFVDMDQASICWSHCVKEAGWGKESYIHGVFDGADWIRRRFEEQFGSHGDWLVDFFHLSEYLAEAGKSLDMGTDWLSSTMSQIKESDFSSTLKTLNENVEAKDVQECDAPVRRALRYIENRIDHLDYARAIQRELPIGSGLTEGAHRHVLHPKLKIPGGWKSEKAHNIAQLIFIRQNGHWDSFWQKAA